MNRFDRPFTFDRVIRILITIGIIAGIFMFINAIKGALLPFLIAWLLAYFINPAVEFCQHKLRIRNRMAAISVSLVGIVAVLGGAVFLIMPSVSAEFSRFTELLDQYRNSSGQLQFIPQEWLDFIAANVNFDEIIHHLNREDIKMIVNDLVPGIMKLFTGSLNVIIGIIASFIVFLYLIFILMDYDKIINGFSNLIPPRFRKSTLAVLGDVKFSMNRYFRGQALVALCVGILYATGFRIIGLPLGIVLGLFIGLLNMVPYLQIVGYLPTLLLCLLKAAETGGNFWLIALGAIGVLVIVQIIQDSFIVPKIMGKITGLNPAIILLSLSIWGSLMGIVGMIIALPMTSLMLSYYQRFIIDNEKIYQEKTPDEEHSSE